MNTRLDALERQFTEATEAIKSISNRASEAGRVDLTDTEQADYDAALNRATDLKTKIDKEKAAEKLVSAAASGNVAVVAETGTELATRASDAIKDGGDFLFNFIRKDVDAAAAQRVRALSSDTSTNSPGLLPYTIVGETVRFIDSNRYVVDSLPHFPIPAGATFKKRVETSSSTIAAQGSEGAEVASGYPTVSYQDITHATYAGGVKLTLQAQQYTDPSAAQKDYRSMLEQYAIKTDVVVCAALKASAANTTVPLPNSGATPQTIMQAIMTAADTVYTNSKTPADTIWCSPDVKTWLATRVDSNGQFAFPMINPQNRDGVATGVNTFNGVSIGGLRMVIDPNFVGSTFIVGASKWGEVYESMYGTFQTLAAATLTTDVVLAGELGTYFRNEGFVRLVDTDGNSAATPNY